MTSKSKEALEKLRRLAVDSESSLSNSSIAREYTAIIEKDLELLEELRKHIVLDITESKISGKNVIVIKKEFDDINVDCTLIFVSDESKEILKRFNKED